MIQLDSLTHAYGSYIAVHSASFTISEGEVVGFLGPNGSGKSTTLRALAGYLSPLEGRAFIAGHDVAREPVVARRLLGYLPETCPLYPEMSVRGFIDFVASLRGLGFRDRRHAVARAADRCGLGPVLGRPINDCSKGYRQRTGLAAAIVHDPPVLILDEPTSGLDPVQVQEIRSLVREMGAKRTVLFSTHLLAEAEATCRRAIVIHEGRIVADGPIEDLKRRAARGKLRMSIEGGVVPEDVQAKLRSLPIIEDVLPVDGGPLRFDVVPRGGEDGLAAAVFKKSVAEGWTLTELTPVEASLEQVFLSVTRGAEG